MPGGKNVVAALTVTAALALALACDGSSGSSSGHPATASGLAAATKDFDTKLIKGDFAGARQYLTRDCRARVSTKGLAAAVKPSFKDLEVKHKVKISDLKVVPPKTRKVTSRTGESLSNVEDKNGKLVEPTSHYDPWQYEEGDWRFTDCSTFAGADTSSVDVSSAPQS